MAAYRRAVGSQVDRPGMNIIRIRTNTQLPRNGQM